MSPTPEAQASQLVTDWCVAYDVGTDESGLLPDALLDLERRIDLLLAERKRTVWESACLSLELAGDPHHWKAAQYLRARAIAPEGAR